MKSGEINPELSVPPPSLTREAEPPPADSHRDWRGACAVLPEPADRWPGSSSADTGHLRRGGGGGRVGCGIRGGLHRLPEPPGPARLRPLGGAGRHLADPPGHDGDPGGPPPPVEAGPRNGD